MTKFNISITSDTVCPWCYIGKNQLDSGIAAYRKAHPGSDDTFDIEWKPFYLNPNSPNPGQDKQKLYTEKFGSAERVQAIFQRVAAVGEQTGIHFSFGGKTGNTRDSHRLIQLAKTKGPEMQTKVVEQIFERYHEKEQDITDRKMLEEAGVSAGLPREEVASWLASDDGGPQVDREVAAAQREFVTGVPHFVIQDKYEVKGAQDAAGFKAIFEKIKSSE